MRQVRYDMKHMIFDGKAFAAEIEERVRVAVLEKAVQPKVVSILVGNDPASELYTRLKHKAAERVGILYEVERVSLDNIERRLHELKADEHVMGVMVQLPIPGLTVAQTEEVLQLIPIAKDVDGLRWRDSGVKPAVVRAVLSIVERVAHDKTTIAILGSGGAVGTPLTKFLRELGYQVQEIEVDTPNPSETAQNAHVVISCVGKAGLVTPEMITPESVVIDVGMSEKDGKVVGDMTQEVYQKASMAVGVPGGVGPVTVASLMQNIVDLT
jgi:methylenetetrahydrofolate dehydrogenase (NADP+)/methenyltetrahydrofolate cyclohydrolase